MEKFYWNLWLALYKISFVIPKSAAQKKVRRILVKKLELSGDLVNFSKKTKKNFSADFVKFWLHNSLNAKCSIFSDFFCWKIGTPDPDWNTSSMWSSTITLIQMFQNYHRNIIEIRVTVPRSFQNIKIANFRQKIHAKGNTEVIYFLLNCDQNFNFWLKYQFLTEISIFQRNFNFWPIFRFLTKM